MVKSLKIEGFKILFDKEDLLSSIDGQRILEKIRRNDLEFTCVCLGIDHPLNMHVRRITRSKGYHYTIVRNSGTMDKHDKTCDNYGSFDFEKFKNDLESNDENEIEEKPINFNIIKKEVLKQDIDLLDDEIYISKSVTSQLKDGHLEPLFFLTDNHKEKELILPNSKNIEIENRRKVSYRYSEMYSIGENIIFHAWHNYVKKHKENPNIERLFKSIYEDPSGHLIGKDSPISINSIQFKPYGKNRYENIDEIIKKAYLRIHLQNNQNYNMFVLGRLVEYKKIENNDNLTILTIEDPQKKNYFNLVIETNRFNNKYSEKPTKADKLISCFVRKNEMGNMEVESFAFIPVTPGIGVSVDSNYEVEFAEYLVKSKILFTKPPKSSNPYRSIFGKSNNPDFLLIDKKSMQEATVVEIFGYDKKQAEDTMFIKKYWDKANKKIEYYKSLPDYNFLYWLAYKNPIPKVYQPKKRGV